MASKLLRRSGSGKAAASVSPTLETYHKVFVNPLAGTLDLDGEVRGRPGRSGGQQLWPPEEKISSATTAASPADPASGWREVVPVENGTTTAKISESSEALPSGQNSPLRERINGRAESNSIVNPRKPPPLEVNPKKLASRDSLTSPRKGGNGRDSPGVGRPAADLPLPSPTSVLSWAPSPPSLAPTPTNGKPPPVPSHADPASSVPTSNRSLSLSQLDSSSRENSLSLSKASFDSGEEIGHGEMSRPFSCGESSDDNNTDKNTAGNSSSAQSSPIRTNTPPDSPSYLDEPETPKTPNTPASQIPFETSVTPLCAPTPPPAASAEESPVIEPLRLDEIEKRRKEFLVKSKHYNLAESPPAVKRIGGAQALSPSTSGRFVRDGKRLPSPAMVLPPKGGVPRPRNGDSLSVNGRSQRAGNSVGEKKKEAEKAVGPGWRRAQVGLSEQWFWDAGPPVGKGALPARTTFRSVAEKVMEGAKRDLSETGGAREGKVDESEAAVDEVVVEGPCVSEIGDRELALQPLALSYGCCQCHIMRDNGDSGMEPTFTLHVNDGQGKLHSRRLMTARRSRFDGRVEFFIAENDRGTLVHHPEDGFFGSVSGDAMGVRYSMWDQGNPLEADFVESRRLMGSITLEADPAKTFTFQRRVRVALPAVSLTADTGTNGTLQPRKRPASLPAQWNDNSRTDVYRLVSHVPVYNAVACAYEADFGRGRCKLDAKLQPAPNNFIITEGDDKRVILLLGKLSNTMYLMEFAHPLSALQAFSIALASIDSKLR